MAIGCGIWYYYGHRNTDPVNVYSFYDVGMTEYWGDTKECYGPVSTDKIQTVYLSTTQTVTEVFVQPGDTVAKGDVLMAFDTTLSDLALERKRLDVEKQKLQLEDAEADLKRIKNLKPMVIHQQKPDNNKPSTAGRPIGNLGYEVVGDKVMNGSAANRPIVCWIGQSYEINDALLAALTIRVEEYQAAAAAQPKPEEPGETEAADPTEGETDPTVTDPTETEPVVTEPPSAAEPVTSFYVVFKTTQGDTSMGSVLTWQGMYIQKDTQTEKYSFSFFDASSIKDPIAPKPTEPEGPSIDYNSGYTANEIAQMRSDKEKEIKELKFAIKMSEADYKIMQCEVDDGKVYADIDGTVVSVLDPEEALMTQQPFMKVSGGGGFYVQGSVSELDKDNLQLGQEVTIMDWNTGMSHVGTVEKIGDYPVSDGFGYGGMGNPNASYYPFTVLVGEEADLQEGYYVSIQYAPAEEAQSGVYLDKAFIRTENGKSYVYVQGEDGTLEKHYVTTGKALWGSYLEILDGLTAEDYLAFPYGKNVKEGALTVESNLSALYGY